MAVTKCSDCKGKVSDQAAICPHCGAPVHAPAVAVAPPKKKSRLRYYAELFGTGLLVFPVVMFAIGKLVAAEPRIEGPHVMVLDGKVPVAWAETEAACETERDIEFPSPKIKCVPAEKAPNVPPGGAEIVRASAREGSTAWRASKYVRYAPGFYSPTRCRARAALLTVDGLQGSFGLVSRYSCEK